MTQFLRSIKILFSLTVALCFSSNAFSQLPNYYVYLVKGDVYVKRDKQKSVKLKPKDFIYPTDRIEIKKDGVDLRLSDKEGTLVQLNKKGNYVANALNVPHAAHSNSITKKYLHLLWEELFESKSDLLHFKIKSIAGSTGGVSRGGCDYIKAPLHRTMTIDDTIKFSWRSTGSKEGYAFKIYNEGDVVFDIILRDTMLIMDVTNWRVDGKINWSVSPLNENCNPAPVYLLTLADTEAIKQFMASITGRRGDFDDERLYYLYAADELSQAGLFEEAEEYIWRAYKLEGK